MKLVTTAQGRAMETYVADEIRSDTNSYLPQAVELAMERYGFLRRPDLTAAPEKGIKFESGRLITERSQISIDNLDIYNDGIIVICRNTTDAELVLQDVVDWGFKTFGLRTPQTPPQRTFTSWVVVDFDPPVSALFAKFAELRCLFATAFESTYGKALDFQVERFAFSVDPKLVAPYTNTQFAIDRRTGAPYSSERFFCSAPLKTDQHIELLRKIERLVSV